jgi:hypothetical protein
MNRKIGSIRDRAKGSLPAGTLETGNPPRNYLGSGVMSACRCRRSAEFVAARKGRPLANRATYRSSSSAFTLTFKGQLIRQR